LCRLCCHRLKDKPFRVDASNSKGKKIKGMNDSRRETNVPSTNNQGQVEEGGKETTKE
jgi:hypothetical protein